MTNEKNTLRLLVVEDNPGDFALLKALLLQGNLNYSEIFHSVKLCDVPAVINGAAVDLIFLDLSLPDSKGIDSVISISRLMPKVPIVVLSGVSDINVAIESISLGAQDYLIKGEFDDKLLVKTIQYSIERKKLLESLLESNERYEMVNRATNDIIWEWDYASNSGIWGEGVADILGSQEENLSKKDELVSRYVHPDDRERVVKNIANFIRKKRQNWEQEFRFLDASGSYRIMYDRGFVIYDNTGTPRKMYGAMTDITQRRKMEIELAQQQLYQQKLITETTIEAQENERTHLGRELHDNINQILATVKMYIGMVMKKEGDTEDLIADSYQYVNEAMEEIRKLSKTLISPSIGDIGLREALAELCENINKVGGTQVNLIYEIPEKKQFGKKVDLMIYRIVQEQLNNIHKYAHAKEIVIRLRAVKNILYLSISDDGLGFDPKLKVNGVGLKNIKSRVEFYSGELEIVSAPGKGCTLEIKVPFNKNNAG